MSAYLIYNGPIYTLDPAQPRVQAIGIRDGRVLAVGSEGKVQAAVGGRAEAINLRGRTVIPGLTDAHVHLTWYALSRHTVRLEDVATLDEAVLRAAEHAESLPPGAWLRGGGWDQNRWSRWPSAADLDALIPDRPAILLRRDGHSAWVNSRALELAGIDGRTPDPPGGSIRREQGQATGLLFENAIGLVSAHLPEPTEAERRAALRAVMAEAHSYGLVGVHIPPNLSPGDAALSLGDLQQLHAAGQLRLRCLVHLGLDRLDEALALGLRSGLGDRWLRLGGVKMFADGSLGSETAEMLSHYEGRRHLGTATMETRALNEAVRKAICGGLAVTVHAIGDAASRRVLDAIALAREAAAQLGLADGEASAQEAGARRAIPDRIEHAQLLHPHDIARFAQLGVVASMQPIHAVSDMDVADQLWGQRCAYAYAWRALKEAGAVLAFGSDAPVEPLNPWPGIHAAVTRQRQDGTPAGGWYPEQRLSVEEALRGFAGGPAHAAGAAYEQGTLAPGMLADLTVLPADPFKINPAELYSMRPELTMIEGEIVWGATKFG